MFLMREVQVLMLAIVNFIHNLALLLIVFLLKGHVLYSVFVPFKGVYWSKNLVAKCNSYVGS